MAKVTLGCVVVAAAAISSPTPAFAQHPSDNPVTSATDAFGLTVGLESTGIYGPTSVRGFSPQAAGNVRIEGLYFDEQGALSDRVAESSTIKVGISAISDPFPAPTGIVDYQLKRSAVDGSTATLILDAGPYATRSVSVDSRLATTSDTLDLPFGVGYQIGLPPGNSIYGSGANDGYNSNVATVSVAPRWSPSKDVSVRAFGDWQDTRNADTSPIILMAGSYLPPRIARGYLGQDFAVGRSWALNYGVLVTAELGPHWSLAAGVFRSVLDTPVSYADFYVDTRPDGVGNHLLVGYPDQYSSSTSGELRLTRHFLPGGWRGDLTWFTRARDQSFLYDGSDVVDAGPASINDGVQVEPSPKFRFGSRTHDHTQLWATGVTYRTRWAERGEFATGLQREHYEKHVLFPGTSPKNLTAGPLRAFANMAAKLGGPVTSYASYTQGFEDSGVAPSSASNRGSVLPTTRTWQADGGVRIAAGPHLSLIAGVFELNKPYFNLDSNGLDRALAVQHATGFELSLAGQLTEDLSVNAGALMGRVELMPIAGTGESIGSNALGQPHSQYLIKVDYKIPRVPAMSLDLSVFHYGSVPEDVKNSVYAASFSVVNLGGRYRFNAGRLSATLRAQVMNVTDVYVWNIGYSPGYFQFPPRTAIVYLTVEI